MVNASLNWASIVGIALAVCGAGLYFMRSFKPALARDYDVFFAAIGLLCGGILFFQGWRLDPILQFGQFLLAGTTVFFAYESVRLRGVAADQARRSSYFDDEPPSSSRSPSGGNRRSWEESYDQFEEPQPLRRRFSGQENYDGEGNTEDDFYRPRRTSRAAIPEQAASRRRRGRADNDSWGQGSESQRRMARFGPTDRDRDRDNSRPFGERRIVRDDQRRGSRPSINQQASKRNNPVGQQSSIRAKGGGYSSSGRVIGKPQGAPIRPDAEDAAFSPSRSKSSMNRSSPIGEGLRPREKNDLANYSQDSQSPIQRPTARRPKPRDNDSLFDD